MAYWLHWLRSPEGLYMCWYIFLDIPTVVPNWRHSISNYQIVNITKNLYIQKLLTPFHIICIYSLIQTSRDTGSISGLTGGPDNVMRTPTPPSKKKWNEWGRQYGGYRMYAYLQCEFSTKTFYKPFCCVFPSGLYPNNVGESVGGWVGGWVG